MPFEYLMQGDCLERMREIPDGYVDLVLCDPPYGTTACAWDAVIPLEPMWKELNRICKGAIVLSAGQPFTSVLISSNLKTFKYTWTWDKVNGIRNHLNAKRQPMRVKEDICVFYKKQPVYNPQMREGGYKSRKTKPGQSAGFGTVTGVDAGREVTSLYPLDILCIPSHDPNNSLHPTQKPIELMEYLALTYSDTDQIILDFTMGSGTTGVACINTGRSFIGIEKDETYFAIAQKRIADAKAAKEPQP